MKLINDSFTDLNAPVREWCKF